MKRNGNPCPLFGWPPAKYRLCSAELKHDARTDLRPHEMCSGLNCVPNKDKMLEALTPSTCVGDPCLQTESFTEVIKLERARQGGFYSNMTVVFIKRKVGDRHARGDASRSPKNAKDC